MPDTVPSGGILAPREDTLRENFTEKKAMKLLSALERKTVELVRISGDIVAPCTKI